MDTKQNSDVEPTPERIVVDMMIIIMDAHFKDHEIGPLPVVVNKPLGPFNEVNPYWYLLERAAEEELRCDGAGLLRCAAVLNTSTTPESAASQDSYVALIERIDAVLFQLRGELLRACKRHAPMHSPHEGHSVIREELDELWDHVKADTGLSCDARKEALQIAAMAVRYVLDLTDKQTRGL